MPARGRRSQNIAMHQQGHSVRAIKPDGPVHDIAVAATVRMAALRGINYSAHLEAESDKNHLKKPRLPITRDDIRVNLRQTRTGNLILFVVDASGSMGARKRMVAVKGAMLSLLIDAYQKRDLVGLIAFRGIEARVLIPPTNSVDLAERQLRQLPTGGRTPLSAGLQLADRVLTQYLHRAKALQPMLVIITDGRSNVPPSPMMAARALARHQSPTILIDSEQGFVRMGQAQQLATWLNAEYVRLNTLNAGSIANRVRQSGLG